MFFSKYSAAARRKRLPYGARRGLKEYPGQWYLLAPRYTVLPLRHAHWFACVYWAGIEAEILFVRLGQAKRLKRKCARLLMI
jgi:hypothetical protein